MRNDARRLADYDGTGQQGLADAEPERTRLAIEMPELTDMKDRDLNSMKYRDIEYAVLARPGRNRWTWTIYPDGKTVKGNIEGNRLMAIAVACRAIDRWLKHHGTRLPLADRA